MYMDGHLTIPAPRGLHGIAPFDGAKGFMPWRAVVVDYLTDEGREDLRSLLHWVEEQEGPITKQMEKALVLNPPLTCQPEQASAEIYRTMGRVLLPDVAMKYRMN